MSDGLYLVFSKPPAQISAADYDRWYHDHIRENIAAPGFVAGRRFTPQPTGVGANPDAGFSHLAVYETAAPLPELSAGLNRRIDDGTVVLPEWFGEISFGSWYCKPIEDRIEATEI
jgi:hypothetical protein